MNMPPAVYYKKVSQKRKKNKNKKNHSMNPCKPNHTVAP